jgi:hypothetical protein
MNLAASWMSDTLKRRFPRSTEELTVTVGLVRGASGYRVVVTPDDPLRKDRFWMFTHSGMKQGHPRVVQSSEAIAEALGSAAAGVAQVVVHMERPGYDLRAVDLRPGAPTQTVVLTRMPNPAYTVIVLSQPNVEQVAEQLRAKLREHGMTVGGADLQQVKREEYKRSLEPSQSEGNRLVHLRQARVDAFVTLTYEQRQ